MTMGNAVTLALTTAGIKLKTEDEIMADLAKMKSSGPHPINGVFSLRPNALGTHFIVCHERGIKIYWADTLDVCFKLKHKDVDQRGKFEYAEQFLDTMLIALVRNKDRGGKRRQNEVTLYDCKSRSVWKTVAFPTERICSVRFALTTRYIIATDFRLHICDVNTDEHIVDIITDDFNLCGLCEVNVDGIMAYPGGATGCVQIVDLRKVGGESTLTPATIKAHEHPIGRLAVSNNSKYVATASLKGTRVCIFDIATKKLVSEFHRGVDAADITFMVFSPSDSWLAVSSDKGTIHVFSVSHPAGSGGGGGGTWIPSLVKRSSYQIKVPGECGCSLMFADDVTLISLAFDGTYATHIIKERDIQTKYDFCYILDIDDDIDDYVNI